MFLPHRSTDDLVFVSRDVRQRPVSYQIEENGNIGLLIRVRLFLAGVLTEVIREQPPHIIGKRNAQLGSSRLGATLRLLIERDLMAHVHPPIMPS